MSTDRSNSFIYSACFVFWYYRAHLDSLIDYCKKGVEEGATLVYGGKQLDRPGLMLHVL